MTQITGVKFHMGSHQMGDSGIVFDSLCQAANPLRLKKMGRRAF
jgi:hypothetical protein